MAQYSMDRICRIPVINSAANLLAAEFCYFNVVVLIKVGTLFVIYSRNRHEVLPGKLKYELLHVFVFACLILSLPTNINFIFIE